MRAAVTIDTIDCATIRALRYKGQQHAIRRPSKPRDGIGTHAISEAPADLDNVELCYSKVFGIGKVSIELRYDDLSPPDESGSDVSGSLSWQQGF